MKLAPVPDDPFDVPDLPSLIRDKLSHGATLHSLEAASNKVVSYQRWGQLSRGERLKNFPEPTSIAAIAQALGITETVAVIATARALGMNVSRRGSAFGQRMPAIADAIPSSIQSTLLHLMEQLGETVAQSEAESQRAEPGTQGDDYPWNQAALKDAEPPGGEDR